MSLLKACSPDWHVQVPMGGNPVTQCLRLILPAIPPTDARLADLCAKRDLSELKRLANAYPDILSRAWPSSCCTLLHIAAEAGQLEIVRYLLHMQPELAEKTCGDLRLTPLHLAAMNGRMEVIVAILGQKPEAIEQITSARENILQLMATNAVLLRPTLEAGYHSRGTLCTARRNFTNSFVHCDVASPETSLPRIPVSKLHFDRSSLLRSYMASCGLQLVSHDKASVYLLPIHPNSSGQPSSRSGCFDKKTTKGGIHERTFSQVISRTADRLFQLATPLLATLLFAYTTYLSVETEGDPLGAAFSLAVYFVFLLSTVSIFYSQSLRNEGSEEKKKKGLYVMISLFCVIGLAFFARVYVILSRPAYCLLMLPWLLPISAILAFYFIRLRIISSASVDAAVAY